MTRHFLKTTSTLLTLSMLPACGSHKHHSQPKPETSSPVVAPKPGDKTSFKLTPLNGKVDQDIQGGWVSECQTLARGSHRLTYKFESNGLIVQDAVDLVHKKCETPALVNTYRLNVELGPWLRDKRQTRVATAGLVQTSTVLKSEQLVQFFNQDLQCGIGDWKLDAETDITGKICLGVDADILLPALMTVSDPLRFDVQSFENLLRVTPLDANETVEMASLFPSTLAFRPDDGRNIGVLHWKNEIPFVGYAAEVKKTLNINNLPLMKGQGRFYVKNVDLQTKVEVENGLMTLTLPVPMNYDKSTEELEVGNFYDEFSRQLYNFRYDPTLKGFSFSYYDNAKSTSVPFGFVSSTPIVFELPVPSALKDIEAPKVEFLSVIGNIKRGTDFEIRFRASDDLSGLDKVWIYFDNKKNDIVSRYVQQESEVVYEGNGVYRVKITVLKASYFSVEALKGLYVVDRAGHRSQSAEFNLPIQN